MITLSQICLKNFLSHSNSKIDFLPNQKLLIDGKSGCGKSSIIDAVVWGLYNQGRVDNRSLIKNGATSASVTIILEEGDKKYLIERSITSKGKHELNILEQREIDLSGQVSMSATPFHPVEVVGTKNLQNFIEQKILHSSYLLFINSIVYPQDSSESFVKQTAVKRKEILLEIIRAADYDEYYKKTKEALDDTRIMQSVNIEKISSLKQEIETNKVKSSDLGGLRIKKAEKTVEIETAQKVLDEAKKKKAKADYIEDKLHATRVVLSGLANKIETSKAKIIESKKKLEDIDKGGSFSELKNKLISFEENKAKLKTLKETEKTANDWNSKMLEVVRNKPFTQDYEYFIKTANQQLLSIMTKNIQECPELKKPCPIIAGEQKTKAQELETCIVYNTEQKEKQDISLKEYDKTLKALGDAPVVDYGQMRILEKEIETQDKAKKELDDYSKNSEIERKNLEFSLTHLELDLQGCEKDQEENNAEKKKLEEELKQFPDMFRQEDEAKIKVNNLQVDLHNLIGAISLAENALKMLQDDEIKLKDIESKQKEINSDLESLGLLKDAFGNNGLKAMLVDHTLPKLENRINEILSELSDFKIQLDTQRKSVDGESVIEGLYINIILPNGEQMDYNSFSGGEKIKITVSLFEGLASLGYCNFRILDESIVSLDSESTSQFIEVLERIQKSVNQLIMISHISEIKECFMDKIEIIKKQGNSQIICS